MRILKPQRIGLMHTQAVSSTAEELVVTGLLGFRLDEPSDFLVDQDLWSVIRSDLGEDEVFDLWVPKEKGELLVWGRAISPIPVETMDVSVECGPLHRRLRVTGDRVWENSLLGWRASNPKKFTEIPLTWKRAYGGAGCKLCPVGAGFDAIRRLESGEEVNLPNIESMEQRVLHPSDVVRPVSFSAVDIRWPAFRIGGSFDLKWLAGQYPAIPLRLDRQVFNLAQGEQRLVSGFWRGDETLVVQGMSSVRSQLHSSLPGVAMRCFFTRERHGSLSQILLRAETVCLFPSSNTGILLFRGEIPNAGTDARKIEALMPAAEWLGQPKTLEHYSEAYRLRTEDSVQMDYSMADLQLMPELTKTQQSKVDGARAEATAERRQQYVHRQSVAVKSAESVLGPSAGLLLGSDRIDEAQIFPFIQQNEISLGQVDLAGISAAAADRRQEALEEMEVWDEQAQSMLGSVSEESEGKMVDVAAQLDRLEQIAHSLERGEKSLEEVIASMAEPNLLEGVDATESEDWIGRVRSVAARVSDVGVGAESGELAAQLRAMVAQARQGFARLEAAVNASDSSSAISYISEAMKASLGDTLGRSVSSQSGAVGGLLIEKLEGMMESGKGADSQFAEVVRSISGVAGAVAQSSEVSGVDSDEIGAKLADFANGVVRIPAAKGMADLYSAAAQSKNAQGLMAWLTGDRQTSNPLIERIEGALQEAGASTDDSGEMPSLRGFAAGHPVLKHWGDALEGEPDTDDDFAGSISDPTSELVKAALSDGKPMSLDALLRLLEDSQGDSEEAGEPAADAEQLEAVAESPNRVHEETDSTANKLDAALSDGTSFGLGASTLLTGTAASFFSAKDELRDARRSARGVPFYIRRFPSKDAARLLDAIRQGRASDLSLVGADLSSADFSGVDLRGVDLRGALMEGSDLSRANLEGSLLVEAVLAGACLDGANLSGADLTRSNLSGVSALDSFWVGSRLDGAVMVEGFFFGASMQGASLDECDALQADFRSVNFSGSSCREGHFQQANLCGASMVDVLWHRVDFLESNLGKVQATRATLSECNLISVSAEQADFSLAMLEKSLLVGSNLSGIKATGLRAEGSSWHGCNLVSAVFDGSCLANANFMEATMTNASLVCANLRYGMLSGAHLGSAALSNTQLFGAAMRAVDLTNADLRGANLEEADMNGALLDRCDMTGANATGGILKLPNHA